MSAIDTVTIDIRHHGQFQTSAHRLDMLMAAYLPASVNDLRKKIIGMRELDCEGHESLAGEHMGASVYCDGSCITEYSDLQTVTECLMILGKLNGYATP